MNNFDSSSKYPIIDVLFIGGVGNEVTGSSTILKITTGNGKVRYGMIDAGAFQGENEQLNYEYPINGSEISFVILTHGHYDHIGALPLLYKYGFRGKVYCSKPVKQIAGPLLSDAATINLKKNGYNSSPLKNFGRRMRIERQLDNYYKDKKNLDSVIDQIEEISSCVLYTQEDVNGVLQLFNTVEMYHYVKIDDDVYAKFIPTTHQNGACRIELYVIGINGTFNMVFSGDIGPSESLLYREHSSYINESVDCLMLESLHGTEEPVETLDESIKKLRKILENAIRHKKTVVLGGFSLDRNAGLIYILNEFKKSGMDIEMIVDSPLTMIHTNNYRNCYNIGNSHWFKKLGLDPFDTSDFKVINSGRDHIYSTLHGEGPRVIVTASAMGGGGRIVNYFKNCIQREDYVFVFCGWISPESASNRLYETKRGAIFESNDGDHFIKKCETIRLHGFTSHGYLPEMLSIVNSYPACKTLILNHADEVSKQNVKERISHSYDGEILTPDRFDAYEITQDGAKKLLQSECDLEFDDVLRERFVDSVVNNEMIEAE